MEDVGTLCSNAGPPHCRLASVNTRAAPLAPSGGSRERGTPGVQERGPDPPLQRRGEGLSPLTKRSSSSWGQGLEAEHRLGNQASQI